VPSGVCQGVLPQKEMDVAPSTRLAVPATQSVQQLFCERHSFYCWSHGEHVLLQVAIELALVAELQVPAVQSARTRKCELSVLDLYRGKPTPYWCIGLLRAHSRCLERRLWETHQCTQTSAAAFYNSGWQS
jgi:hypothetical protein